MTTQHMLSKMRKCISQYDMIQNGDKIAVGVSGGKDSLCLLYLLSLYKKFSNEKFDLIAITVDLNFNNKPFDCSNIKNFCEKLNIEYKIVNTDIGKIVFDIRKENSPCSLCSKMRKGALYEEAVKSKANKIALGHHADDLIDTFLLSLFYEGRLSTFAPKSYLSRTKLTLIRPLLMIKEEEIKAISKELPVLKSKCPIDKKTKRELVKNLREDLEKKFPNASDMIYTSLVHPERYKLFDKFNNQITNKD